MTNLKDKMKSSFKELDKSKVERYEKAAITHILKHFGVKKTIPDDPGVTWLMDEVPEWNMSTGVISTRLEHNWIEFFKPRNQFGHPVEELYNERISTFQLTEGEYADLIIIFKWMPEKFMVLSSGVDVYPEEVASIRTSKGFLVTTLDDYLDAAYPK